MAEGCTIPPQYAIDYEALLSTAREECQTSMVSFLRERLLLKWRDAYVETIEHEPNLVHLRCGNFQYICDVYSDLELIGEVPFNQTIANRVVGALGISAAAGRHQGKKRIVKLSRDSEPCAVTERDNGHFMARSIGGGLDVNLFSQDRLLNRGWSSQGKVYRRMEKYCREQEGTFCFSRPIYCDGSNVPRWLEFGVLKNDETLWVEAFDN